MIETTTVSSKGQIVIPEKMRKKLHIKEGTKMIIVEKEQTLMLETQEEFLKKIPSYQDLEKVGWLSVAEKSLTNTWNNKKDDKAWSKYL